MTSSVRSTNAMGTSTVRRQLYLRLAIGLLAAAGAYVWYVTVQYGRINDLNQRQLANAAAELKNSLENAIGTVGRFNPAKDDTEALCQFDVDQPYLTLQSPELCGRVTGRLVNPTLTSGSGLSIEATAEVRSLDKKNPSPASRAHDAISFAFDTGTVLRELSFSESYGLIFIADSSGEVIFQDAPAKRIWLRQLRWNEQQFRDSAANRSGSLRLERLAAIFGDDKSSGWVPLSSMSGRTTLRLGGRFHELYVEPLMIENQGERVNLVLGGAVPTEAVVRQALAVDSYFLAAIVFLLFVAVLGYPFVKLMALDSHERFRLRDVMKLYLSTAALLALATFTIQALDAYARWHDVADGGMQRLAGKLESAFLKEIADIQQQEDGYDQKISEWLREQPSKDVFTRWDDSEKPPLPVPKQSTQIIQVTWIDPQGYQVRKITRDATSSRQRVPQRVYFRSVRDGSLFMWPDHVPCEKDEDPCNDLPPANVVSTPFFLGPDRSITDGKFYTFMSMRSRLSREGQPGPYVVSATARLFSLNTPALPAGYGFALINREGRVLYHSDQRLSLRENLFEELTEGTHARALVYSGQQGSVTSAYRERPHELHFRPVSLWLATDRSAAGLYLVTFRDISLERALVARVFLISMFGPMLVLLAFIGVSLLAMSMVPVRRSDGREHWSAWLWPHGDLGQAYQEMSIVLAVLLTASAGAWAVGADDAVFVAVPLLAVASAVLIYAIRTLRKTRRVLTSSSTWHSVVYILVLACMIVIPASALFRAAMGHEFGKLIATEQKWIAGLKIDLPLAEEAELRAEKRPAKTASDVKQTRTEYLSQIPSPAPFDTDPSSMKLADSTQMLLEPFHWSADLLPIESDSSARVRFEEGRFWYMPSPARLGISPWAIVALIGAFGLLLWWVHWKQVRLFYANEETSPEPQAPPAMLWGQCTADERMVLLRVAEEHIENPYQRPVVIELLKRGLLTFGPDLRPCSRPFAEFIATQRPALEAALQRWEAVDSGHSWRYTRVVLFTSVGGLFFFIVATQPGLQAGLVSVAGGVTIALESLLKLRDAVVVWLGRRRTAIP